MFEKAFDIVIIGSGAGGGAVAKELAPLCGEGIRIAVLEWGPKLRNDEFTGNEVDMARKLFVDSGGMLTKDGSMTLAMGKGYGGSTVSYTGTSLTVPKEVVDRWAVPGLSHGDIASRAEKYLEENNVHLQPEELLNDNNRLFRKGCRTLGYSVEQFPLNLKGCKGAGVCNLGCPNQAKQGTHLVQLPEAERAGVEVVTNCRVEHVGIQELEAVVENAPFGDPSTWDEGRYRISAKIIVVCAGAVHSSALFLNSGFGDRLPALGRYLTLHPALILVGEHLHPISNFQGHPKSFFCDHFWRSDGFLLESCMYYPFITAKNLVGFGPEHSQLMQAFQRLQMILVLAVDQAEADNRVEIDGQGNPVVDYTLSSSTLDSLYLSMKAASRIFFAAGAARVHAPAGERFFIEAAEAGDIEELISRNKVVPGRISITSAHLMGGCRMGEDLQTSVTDSWGRVHGHPGLFVADSSLLPRANEINPYLTVMALADRVAERIRSDIGELL
ncbi:MAG: GMC family oxidoreductase [Acidobacteriota bacterium]